MSTSRWPKTFPPLTAEQEQIRDDFMPAWHEHRSLFPPRAPSIELDLAIGLTLRPR